MRISSFLTQILPKFGKKRKKIFLLCSLEIISQKTARNGENWHRSLSKRPARHFSTHFWEFRTLDRLKGERDTHTQRQGGGGVTKIGPLKLIRMQFAWQLIDRNNSHASDIKKAWELFLSINWVAYEMLDCDWKKQFSIRQNVFYWWPTIEKISKIYSYYVAVLL